MEGDSFFFSLQLLVVDLPVKLAPRKPLRTKAIPTYRFRNRTF